MNLDYIFPTPVWWVDLDIDLAKMEDITYNIAHEMPSKARSNRGLLNYQSPDFMGEQILADDSLGDDEFKKLLQQIKAKATEAFGSYGSCHTTIEYANAWFNINGKGGYNEVHTHPGAVMSGAFYVKVPEGECGRLTFHKDASEGFLVHSIGTSEDMSTAEVPHTHSTRSYPPIAGRLFLFPAWVAHGVRENETDGERVSISFNFIPVRNKQNMFDIIKQNESSSISYDGSNGSNSTNG